MKIVPGCARVETTAECSHVRGASSAQIIKFMGAYVPQWVLDSFAGSVGKFAQTHVCIPEKG